MVLLVSFRYAMAVNVEKMEHSLQFFTVLLLG